MKEVLQGSSYIYEFWNVIHPKLKISSKLSDATEKHIYWPATAVISNPSSRGLNILEAYTVCSLCNLCSVSMYLYFSIIFFNN